MLERTLLTEIPSSRHQTLLPSASLVLKFYGHLFSGSSLSISLSVYSLSFLKKSCNCNFIGNLEVKEVNIFFDLPCLIEKSILVFGMDMYTLLFLKWITNKDLL